MMHNYIFVYLSQKILFLKLRIWSVNYRNINYKKVKYKLFGENTRSYINYHQYDTHYHCDQIL